MGSCSNKAMMIRIFLLVAMPLLLSACATMPPKDIDNICAIFKEKRGWYRDAHKASKRWGSPIPVMMAMMHQESRFKSKAKPPRTKILWLFPGPRPSTAFGYSQALDITWKQYIRSAGNYGADRDDFGDAIDFIGWYNQISHRRSNIKPEDAYHLYLAYHEGHGGFNRRTFKDKLWLKKVSRKVSAKAIRYRKQLHSCEKHLASPWWHIF